MTKLASIATNDPENDPTPRIRLERIQKDGLYVWCDEEGNEPAGGKTPEAADAELRFVYNFHGWDLRFHRNTAAWRKMGKQAP